MQKWEYKIEDGRYISQDGINKLGAEGWELVAVKQDRFEDDPTYYFKRPKS